MPKGNCSPASVPYHAQSGLIRWARNPSSLLLRGMGQRGLLLGLLATVILLAPGAVPVALDAMSEAYVAVAVFVAGTLMLIMAAERGLETDIGVWLERHRGWQVPAATLLGALPGCGGAIIAVTQFTRGYLSFGSVVATLVATMGDAMFLFLAREPETALLVLVVSLVAGLLTGYGVDRIHGPDFLRPETARGPICSLEGGRRFLKPVWRAAGGLWLLLMVPGIILGILGAFQIDADAFLVEHLGLRGSHWLGVAGAVLGLVMWAAGDKGQPAIVGEETGREKERAPLLPAVITTTNFIMTWVIFAFIGYELLVSLSGIDLGRLFTIWAPVVPAAAILVGFIPGCGPQIMVTTLYLSGTLPLSAQFGNAIANDGDALFPAIAVAPKAALIATVYSAIPALVVAYGWHVAFEAGG